MGIVSGEDVDVEDSGDNEDEPSMEVLMMMKLAPFWSIFFVVSGLSWLVWFG